MEQIPIVVGGTTYWMQHLIFPDRLIPKTTGNAKLSQAIQKSLLLLPQELQTVFHALPSHQTPKQSQLSPTSEEAFARHKLLTALDPAVAARWHWKDTRKVLRSLQIIRDTGQTPSDFISAQSQTCIKPRSVFL